MTSPAKPHPEGSSATSLPEIQGVATPDNPGVLEAPERRSAPSDLAPNREPNTFMAQFRSGPDPEVAAILAETERHAEDNRWRSGTRRTR